MSGLLSRPVAALARRRGAGCLSPGPLAPGCPFATGLPAATRPRPRPAKPVAALARRFVPSRRWPR